MKDYRTRRRPTRAELLARLPHGLRPRLPRDQVRDLGIVHAQLIDDIERGAGTEQTLWDYVEALLTWSPAAELTGDGIPEMADLLRLGVVLIGRYRDTGRIAFEGDELQQAVDGRSYMDQLAARVAPHTADLASEWSARRIAEMGMPGVVPCQ